MDTVTRCVHCPLAVYVKFLRHHLSMLNIGPGLASKLLVTNHAS